LIAFARLAPKECALKAGKSSKEDLLIYVLSGLAATWAIVWVVDLLIRAK
jgi:hypothetical protein